MLIGTSAMAQITTNNMAEEATKEMEREAREVIAQMTLDEKIGQLMHETPGIERLGIKPYNWWNEGLHGVGRTGRATVFPQPIGLGASFDPELVEQIGDAVATEGRAKYNVAQKMQNYTQYAGLTFWSPNVNIFRDPRWGRGMETYGEDPYLTGTLGSAYVWGLQGHDSVYLKSGACAKHYAVHSGPEETRHEADIHPTKRDLFETYLPAFEMLVKEAKVETVMSAYNSVYGDPCSSSHYLLTEVLRERWGFKGHVVSDCGAVSDIYKGHAKVKTKAEAAAAAIKAALNVECGHSFRALREAVDAGLIQEDELDEALVPLMMTRLKLGILRHDERCPYNEMGEEVICCEKHTQLALRAAEESMVLLKNDRGILPLPKDLRTMYICGEGATDIFCQMGNYYGLSPRYSSYLQGIVSKVSSGSSVNFRPGFMNVQQSLNSMNWALEECAGADYSVLVMGNTGNTEGEEGEAILSSSRGDRTDIKLPESQMDFLRRVKAEGAKNLIVILTGGSPIDMREICQLADVVILTWYPGQEGGEALGNLLFGDAQFSGRLPMTFPEDVKKLPAFDDYTMQGRTYKYMTDNVYFPFGYGLTYGKVVYDRLHASAIAESREQVAESTLALEQVEVSVKLRNDSTLACEEVAQVYVSAPGAGKTAPLEQLVAYQRVKLGAHEEKEVRFVLPIEKFFTVQEDGEKALVGGEYTITVGGAAPCKRSEELGVSQATAKIKL